MSLKSLLKQTVSSGVAITERACFPQPPLSDVRNFLLLQYPRALGTAIHATPIVRALHATLPGSRVIAAASGFGAQVLRNNPGIEHLVETPSPFTAFAASVRSLRAEKLFDGKPFATLQTFGNERTRVSFLAMLGGAHLRVGSSVLPHLSRAVLAYDPSVSLIENNLHILNALGHGKTIRERIDCDPGLLEPQLFPDKVDFEYARSLLVELGVDLSRPIAVFVTQTYKAQRKSWRVERFRIVAESIARNPGMQIVFAGTESEVPAIDDLRAALSIPSANAAGRTNILQLAALFQLADIALTLDTGPLHIARAVGVPMVVIAPAWSPPIEWLPVHNPRVRILKNATLPSSPPDYIIDEVSVAEVLSNLHELLALYPPRVMRQ